MTNDVERDLAVDFFRNNDCRFRCWVGRVMNGRNLRGRSSKTLTALNVRYKQRRESVLLCPHFEVETSALKMDVHDG